MKKLSLLLVSYILLFSACKKNTTVPENINNYTKEQLKALLIGKWKIHYYTGGGGLAGGSPNPTYLNNSFWTFTTTDSLYEKIENWNNAGKINFIRSNQNSWQIVDFDPNQLTNFPINWFIDNLKGDTLIATFNASSSPTRYMTKLP